MLLQRFCKAFHKNDFFGLNFPLTLFVCWVVTKTLGCSCTNHVMVNSMPKEMAHGSSTSLERLGMGASSYGSMLVVVV
jgi:hypothetical protein